MERLQNEKHLVEEMQAGSQKAFAILYHHYSPHLYLNILRMVRDPVVAEEIIQELFTRIWNKRDSPGIRENFAGYIYRISQHLVHDFFRRLKRDKILLERFRMLAQENYDPIEEGLMQQQTAVILQQAVNQLSPQQKKVYELVNVEGCTYKKAAEILGISPFTVKEYLVTTRKTIRKYLVNHLNSLTELLLILLIAATL